MIYNDNEEHKRFCVTQRSTNKLQNLVETFYNWIDSFLSDDIDIVYSPYIDRDNGPDLEDQVVAHSRRCSRVVGLRAAPYFSRHDSRDGCLCRSSVCGHGITLRR